MTRDTVTFAVDFAETQPASSRWLSDNMLAVSIYAEQQRERGRKLDFMAAAAELRAQRSRAPIDPAVLAHKTAAFVEDQRSRGEHIGFAEAARMIAETGIALDQGDQSP